MKNTRITRRQFVQGTATAAAALSCPLYVPARLLGKQSPSNTLRMAAIGTGRMGHGDMTECQIRGLEPGVNAHIVAVCDLDSRRAKHAKQQLESTYAKKAPDIRTPEITIWGDYRELLARDDIDGVTISTPDHWHALLAVAAAEAGKAIYLQKPLTYTIGEGKQLVAAVRKHGVIFQTGSQQRSDKHFRRGCEYVRNGRIGKLHTIRVVLPPDSGTGTASPMEVPSNLNYAMWMGPTAEQPYTEHRVHPQADFSRPGWLQIETYSRGMITGWGAHMFDIAQWGHGSDNTGPIEIEATGEFPDRGLFNVHTNFKATAKYADGVEIHAETGGPAGVHFDGDAGSIFVSRGKAISNPASILEQPLADSEQTLYRSSNHMRNYLECIRSGHDTVCPVEVGHRSNTICVMAHIAMKLGRKLRWDPKTERFIGDESANAMLDYDHRKPWTIGKTA
ncbi:MAG: Gfo/Idh/MocA family oxidoreductase [Pirellulales bacterium]|nr:Gfo/Idh/MocA family oxidoreductase [Pirellulales bacterium]